MNDDKKQERTPPPTLSRDPQKELEERVTRNPDDADAKVDVGSDESMDASDPVSAARSGDDREPVRSSGFPEE